MVCCATTLHIVKLVKRDGAKTMCGRYNLGHMTWADLCRLYDLGLTDSLLNIEQNFNVTPTSRMPIIRNREEDGREAVMARWGLVPFWHKGDIKAARMLNNARAESVATTASFREPFKRRRCLIPADGFYEWTGPKSARLPWYISMGDGGPLTMAGLWDQWEPNDGTPAVDSFSIITTGPNKVMEPIHERMPVFLDPHQFDTWLNVNTDAPDLLAMLRPYRDDALIAYRVGTEVNSNKASGPSLIEPLVEEKAGQGTLL